MEGSIYQRLGAGLFDVAKFDPVSTQFDICVIQGRLTLGCTLDKNLVALSDTVASVICFLYSAYNRNGS